MLHFSFLSFSYDQIYYPCHFLFGWKKRSQKLHEPFQAKGQQDIDQSKALSPVYEGTVSTHFSLFINS